MPLSRTIPPQPGHALLLPFLRAFFRVLQKAGLRLDDDERWTALLLVRCCAMQCC